MAEPNDNLYLRGLPGGVTEQFLQSIFGQHGSVKSIKILPVQHKNEAAAMMKMGSTSEAQWLVENLSGKTPQGMKSPVNISFAYRTGKYGSGGKHEVSQQITDRFAIQTGKQGSGGAYQVQGKGKGKGKGDKGKGMGPDNTMAEPSDNLHLTGLPGNITQQFLQSIFGQHGLVKSIKILPVQPGKPASAMMKMGSIEEAQRVVQNLSGNIPQGMTSPVYISFAFQTGKYGSGSKHEVSQQSTDQFAIQTGNYNSGGAYNASQQMDDQRPRFDKGKGKGDKGKGMLPNTPMAQPNGNLYPTGQMNQQIPNQFAFQNGMYGSGPAYQVNQQINDQSFHGEKGKGKGDQGKGFLPNNTMAQPNDNLYLKGLPVDSTEQFLLSIFGQYGLVKSIKILPVQPGKNEASVMMQMGSVEEAQWLVDNLNGNIAQGMTSPVYVSFALQNRKYGPGGGA